MEMLFLLLILAVLLNEIFTKKQKAPPTPAQKILQAVRNKQDKKINAEQFYEQVRDITNPEPKR